MQRKLHRMLSCTGLAIIAVLSLCAMTCQSCLPVDDKYPLVGTWTLKTTPISGRDLGDGSFELTYSETQLISGATIYNYTGTGNLFSRSYTAGAIQEITVNGEDAVLITLAEVSNESNYLSFFQATISGDGESISGNMYSGWNEYANDAGTFTATKN